MPSHVAWSRWDGQEQNYRPGKSLVCPGGDGGRLFSLDCLHVTLSWINRTKITSHWSITGSIFHSVSLSTPEIWDVFIYDTWLCLLRWSDFWAQRGVVFSETKTSVWLYKPSVSHLPFVSPLTVNMPLKRPAFRQEKWSVLFPVASSVSLNNDSFYWTPLPLTADAFSLREESFRLSPRKNSRSKTVKPNLREAIA